MEMKQNCIDYKKFNGADTVNEFVQALKFLSYDSSAGFDVERYNPVRGGYLQLADLSRPKKNPATILVHNRFDLMGDGVTVNAYERIRRNHIQEMCGQSGRELKTINYKRLASLHKFSKSMEDYRELVKVEIN